MADHELDMNDDIQAADDQDSAAEVSSSLDTTETEAVIQASSQTAHEQLRKAMEDEVAAFLARGGKIQQVDSRVTAESMISSESHSM